MHKKIISLLLGSAVLALGTISLSCVLSNESQKSTVVVSATGKSSYWSTWISNNSSALSTGGTTLVSALKSKITQVADGSSNTISYNGLWSAYQTSDPVPGSNGAYIWDMYGGFQFAYQSGGSSYSKEGDCYNREHSVPKSWFSEHTPAYSDLVHLLPTDGKVNGMRSNYTFGEVDQTSYSYSFPARSYGGNQYQAAGVSKLGTPKKINNVSSGKSVVFEPDDQYKGDFARIYMYFAVRYGGGTCQATSGDGGAIFTSTFTNANPYVTNYGLALLQKWHVQDPVSGKETNRNDAIESLQGNRNPFVDYPEWADKIFGTSYSGVSISDSSAEILVGSTKTISATSTDSGTISWSSSNTGVATVSPSSSASGASVTITAVAAGSATITASSGGKSATCSVTVSTTKTLSSISVSTAPTKISYTAGEYFDPTGLVIRRTYSDSSYDTYTYSGHTSEFTFSPSTSTALTTSNNKITISYSGKSCDQTITVSSSGGGGGETSYTRLTSISNIDESANYVLGVDGTGFHYSGTSSWGLVALPSAQTPLHYTLKKGSGNTTFTAETTISSTKYYLTVPTSNAFTMSTSSTSIKLGTTTSDSNGDVDYAVTNTQTTTRHLRINGSSGLRSYAGTTGTMAYFYKVESSGGGNEPTLASISVSTAPTKTSYTAGECFDPTGLEIIRNYSDSSFDTYAYAGHTSEFSFEPDTSTALTVGDDSVTITYDGKSCIQDIEVNAAAPVSITASVSKTYYVGETISSSDITVKDQNNNTLSGFSFANDGYQFTYSDAASGGSSTSKTFASAVSYSSLTCSLTVQVQRKAYVAPTTSASDTLTYSDLTATDTSYKDFSGVTKSSSAVYAGNSAKGNSAIQLNSSSPKGIVTTSSGGTISSISVSWYSNTSNGRTLNIYGKNTAYSSSSDLYGSNKGTLIGTIVKGTSTELQINGSYTFVGVCSAGSALYLNSITFNYGSAETAVNISNYIMYADTANQCTTKLNTALGYLSDLTQSELTTFQTSDDYVISTARTRLEAWARNQGKTINYTVSNVTANAVKHPLLVKVNYSSIITISAIIGVSIFTIGLVGGYIYYRKKKIN